MPASANMDQQNSSSYTERFHGMMGPRRGLPGELVLYEIEGAISVTNYRVIQRQQKSCMDYYVENPVVGLDVWLHQIIGCYPSKESYPRVYLTAGLLIIAAGLLGLKLETFVPFASFTQIETIAAESAQILLYLVGALVLTAGQYYRRRCIVIGILDYDRVHGDKSFEVPLQGEDVVQINVVVDLIREVQLQFVARQQHTHTSRDCNNPQMQLDRPGGSQRALTAWTRDFKNSSIPKQS